MGSKLLRYMNSFHPGVILRQPQEKLFTRERIQRYARIRDMIQNAPHIDTFEEKDLEGKWRRIWRRDSVGGDRANVVFLTAAELHPDFHIAGDRPDNVEILHELNKDFKSKENEWIRNPAVFHYGVMPVAESHNWLRKRYGLIGPYEDHYLMKEHNRQALFHLCGEWESSKACHMLRARFEQAARSSPEIRKIVCFGLGRICKEANDELAINKRILQHFMAFTFASVLNAMNPNAPPVSIVFQDPAYNIMDECLLRQWYPEGTIKFVDMPDGFLEIDDHSFVMTHWLPYEVPLLQITADIARPVAIMTDVLYDVKPEDDVYTISNPSSPRVAEMLESYQRTPLNPDADITEYGMPSECAQWVEWSEIWWRSDTE